MSLEVFVYARGQKMISHDVNRWSVLVRGQKMFSPDVNRLSVLDIWMSDVEAIGRG